LTYVFFVTPASDEFNVTNFPYDTPGLDERLSVGNDLLSALIKKLKYKMQVLISQGWYV